MKKILTALLALSLTPLAAHAADSKAQDADNTLLIYSARKEELIKPLLDQFTKETGITLTFLTDEAPKLVARLEAEGKNTKADVFLTADVANLGLAKSKQLLSPVKSEILTQQVPAAYHDKDGEWWGFTRRVRVVVYNKDKVKPEQLSTYEDLADPKWKGEFLSRSSQSPYNQSLVAAYLLTHGEAATEQWAKGLVANFARVPQGGDTDQLKAVAAGEGSIAITNHYYFARLLHSPLPEERKMAEKLAIFFPNQSAKEGELQGVNMNISGGGIVKYSSKKAQAQKLLEFLAGDEAQRIYGEVNFEYPVNPKVAAPAALKELGEFKPDTASLTDIAAKAQQASMISDRAGWK